ncbi:unnamed protein product [Adineta steineri]|uniref:RNA-directed DNA polymerase n=2 Tax=Adineta steineri TaxID=433720 RepID=A0A819KR37_9BILA|nr:unnamed protein product [Adineta steineri]CAF3985122.1 unnamed protein product [Adineta steineri]
MLNDEQTKWYEQNQGEIKDDWKLFCDHLEQMALKHQAAQLNISLHATPPSSNHAMTTLEEIIDMHFNKYSGASDAKEWLLQTMNKFKIHGLRREDQFEALPLLLEGATYVCIQDTSIMTTAVPDNSSTSHLQRTVADDIIKRPTYFRGAHDDWNDENKLHYISIHLQDDAYRWWTQTGATIRSWSSFKEAITRAFSSTRTQELAFEQLKSYKQTINQTITQYYDKVIELCKKVDPAMPDSLKLKYLMAGIKESLKTHVALEDPKTSEAFLSSARKMEDIFAFTHTNNSFMPEDTMLNVTASQSQPNQSSHMQATDNLNQNNPRYTNVQRTRSTYYSNQSAKNQTHQQNQHWKGTKSARRSNACFNCGTPGHFARDCTRPHFHNPSTLNTSLLYLDVIINNKCMKAMIDTGANRAFISYQALPIFNTQQFINPKQKSASLAIFGSLDLHVVIGDMSTSIKAYVVKNLCVECILGMDFISKYKVIIDVDERAISLCIDGKRIMMKFNGNREKSRHPARTTHHIYVPPKQMVSIPVQMAIPSAEVLIRPSYQLTRQSPMILLNKVAVVDQQTTCLSIYNPTSYYYTIPKGIVLRTTTVPTLSFSKCISVDQQLVDHYICKLTRHIKDPVQKEAVEAVLRQHEKLLDTSKPSIAVNVKPHEIKILDHPPPSSRPYSSTPHKKEEMYRIVQELLYHGLVRKSYSPYASPALLVSKHDGSWRMVVDYKKLNNITIKDNHPLPNMEQTIRRLGGGYQFFSKLDMKSGFWQIPIKEEDKHKTAFVTADGLYEWNVLAQGLRNSPPSFQRVMGDILQPCRQFSLVYLDDIVVFSRSFGEHLDHLQQLLSILSEYNFQLNPPKCKGLSWYRKCIPRFASIAAPIHKVTNLTKENKKNFRWEEPQHEAFLQLQKFLTTSPLLLDYPNDNYPVILTTDASKVGIGGTLQQKIGGEIKNLYYHSQVTSPIQQRYDPIELEALAIWMCFQRMRPYLLGRSIIIYTDYCPLCNMMNSTVKNRRVDRISILLQEYNIEKIIHIKVTTTTTTLPVKDNTTIPSARSKSAQIEQHSAQFVVNNSLDIERIKMEQANDPIIQEKIKEVTKNPSKATYEFKDGLLYKLLTMQAKCSTKKKLLYVPSSMINDLLQVYHSNPLSGHFGVHRTYLKIKNKYWWPDMKQSITQYIQSCLLCQQFNVSRMKKPGRLQPIPPPDGPFQLIGMDYCGPFKQTPRGNQYVLCITDYFTRWIVAAAVPDCTAQTTAEALFNDFICKYGVPAIVLSDQGTHFHNQLMEAMSKLIGYDHTYSTTYHPQSNGMIERFNATFVPQIAKLQDRENNNWDEFLAPVVFAYNTGGHSTTQYSPFQLLYGREPRLPADGPITSFTFRKPNDYYEQLKKSMKLIHTHARQNTPRKQQQYKNRYDKQRFDLHYAINDRVLIRKHGMKNKLEPKFSITPQVIIREQHPVYIVRDETTKIETQVHANDIRPIYGSTTSK